MIELLQGLRVLECAILPSGDHTGQLLGDLGADVIKVERPGEGDYLRELGGTIVPHHSVNHLYANRNKRSITLNLRSEEGRALFFTLLLGTDIFVDGFAGDACDRLGIGYEEQRKVKPDIIYCQSTGFGVRGPYGHIPVHGGMMGAAAGTYTVEVGDDGLVRDTPPPEGLYHPGRVDGAFVGAVFAVLTTVAALHYRDRAKEGVYIDAAGADATLACRQGDMHRQWNTARITDSSSIPPASALDPRQRPKYNIYATQDDKFVYLVALEPKFWRNLCRAIERPDLERFTGDELYCDFQDEDGSQVGLTDELSKIFRQRTLAEWMEVASCSDIPLGPVHDNTADVLSDPNFLARDIINESVHPLAGPFTSIGWPALVSGQEFEARQPAPTLGEHTEDVLSGLGLSPRDIERLRATGVV